jgi:hypothetical protein
MPRRRARLLATTLAPIALIAGLAACSTSEPPAPTVSKSEDVGKAFTSDEGLAVTVDRRLCGISGVGAENPEFTAAGQYCTVGVTVDNGTGEDVDLMPLSISGWDDGTQYFPDYWAGSEADGGLQKVLAAGETLESTLFFDMPKTAVIDELEVSSPWSGIESFSVKF